MHLLFIALLYFPSKKIIILYFKRERWFFFWAERKIFFLGRNLRTFLKGEGLERGFFEQRKTGEKF